MNAWHGTISGIVTVSLLLVFVAIWVWAWRPRHRDAFDRMSRLPMEETDGPEEPAGSSPARRTSREENRA